MNNTMTFADGMNVYRPNEKTQGFLFGTANFKVDKFIAFLQANKDEKGYVKVKFPLSKKTNEPYVILDTFVPKKKEEDNFTSEGFNGEAPIDVTNLEW
jgi:hypothetical protein